MDLVSIPVSLVSLAVSLGTFWFVFVARGKLGMTKPTIIFFGFDLAPRTTPKVFLRTLLYSTSNRGHVVEGMFMKVIRAGNEQIFGFWGYGEGEKQTAGSGVHVSKTGLAANHHFVLSVHQPGFGFAPGDYVIEVFANVVGRKKALRLSMLELTLPPDLAAALDKHEGVLFERTIGGEYEGHTR